VFYAGLAADEPDVQELTRMRREAEEQHRLAAQTALADLAFAVFLARGRIGGRGSSNHALTWVEVEHGAATGQGGPWLRVMTERERHRYESEVHWRGRRCAHWSAAGRRDDLLLLLTSRDVDLEEVQLVSVTDPIAALAAM
jgi:hypothetical protein